MSKRKKDAAASNEASQPNKVRKSTIARQSESHMQHVIKIKETYCAAIIELCINVLKKSECLEFEVRLGKYNAEKKTFQSGVSKEFFNEILTSISAQAPQESERQVVSEIVYYYSDHNIRGVKKEGQKKVQYETFERYIKTDFQQETELLYDLRFNLKNENPIYELPFDPAKVAPKSVRYKSRQSFEFSEHGFRIDCTVALQTKNEGQMKRLLEKDMNDEANEKYKCYEIEFEITDPENVDSMKIAQSLFALLGYGENSGYPLMPVLLLVKDREEK